MSNTQYVKASVTELYDLSTQQGRSTVFEVGTPRTRMVLRHLMGHMLQYQKMRYYGCSVLLQPAARLPADPLQVSLEAGDPGIDPRDLTNPILHRPFRGETDAFNIKTRVEASEVFGGTVGDANAGGLVGWAENTELGIDDNFSAYYLALMDRAWRKSAIQSPLKVNCIPLVRTLATVRQIGPQNFNNAGITPESYLDAPIDPDKLTDEPLPHGAQSDGIPTPSHEGLDFEGGRFDLQADAMHDLKVGIDRRGFRQSTDVVGFDGNDATWNNPSGIFTHKFERLGWRDTLSQSMRGIPMANSGSSTTINSSAIERAMRNVLNSGIPAVPMYRFWMPPAYKQEFYFRMYIRHHFGFKTHTSAYGPLAGVVYTTAINDAYNRAIRREDGTMENIAEDQPEGGTVSAENGTVRAVAEGSL